MIYYAENMEMEVISELFRGSVNSVEVCRNRLSASGEKYTLIVISDRECAKKMLAVMESSDRGVESPCITRIAHNEKLIFVFPYREERKFSAFAKGQVTSPEVGEQICINLVMECISTGLPWQLLYLVLKQDQVQIAQDNTVYFSVCLALDKLDIEKTEKSCVSACAKLLLKLLASTGEESRKKRLKSFELIRKKSAKNAYTGFPELYQDIKLTALPKKKASVKSRVKGWWLRNRDMLFKVLLVICMLLVIAAAAAFVTQMIVGDVPWLRLFQNSFDVIGTENLHKGGRL